MLRAPDKHPAPPPDRPRTVDELLSRPDACRYITGDIHADHEFCDQPRRRPSAYCADHHARCYKKGRPVEVGG